MSDPTEAYWSSWAKKYSPPNWRVWRQVDNAELWVCVLLSLNVDPCDEQVGDWQEPHLPALRDGNRRNLLEWCFNERTRHAASLLEPLGPLKRVSEGLSKTTVVSLGEFVSVAIECGWEIPSELQEIGKNSRVVVAAWDGFDEDSEFYPQELDIANLAWRAVTKNLGEAGAPKERLRRWLDTHYPNLSEEAKDRIAKVCNWNKRGGRRLCESE